MGLSAWGLGLGAWGLGLGAWGLGLGAWGLGLGAWGVGVERRTSPELRWVTSLRTMGVGRITTRLPLCMVPLYLYYDNPPKPYSDD